MFTAATSEPKLYDNFRSHVQHTISIIYGQMATYNGSVASMSRLLYASCLSTVTPLPSKRVSNACFEVANLRPYAALSFASIRFFSAMERG